MRDTQQLQTVPNTPSASDKAPERHAVPHLNQALSELLDFCRQNDWTGYDPYDGLNSRVFQRSPVRHSKFVRFAFIQFLKRSPVNLRGLLAVTPEPNPKAFALFVSALVKLTPLGLADAAEVRSLAERLLELRSRKARHFCWGYNFDWQTRGILVPKWEPNIICTTFAANALLDAFTLCGDPAFLEAASSAGRFLLEGLNSSGTPEESCFSYTPLDHAQIHNANLLGAALLARLFPLTDNQQFKERCLACTQFSLKRMRPDGSWPYGEESSQQWVDSFHTGYNLLALREIQRAFSPPDVEAAIRRGFRYYREHFLETSGIVKYYHDRRYPIDTHAVAHAILTLCEFSDFSSDNAAVAERVFSWAFNNMRSPSGWYYFQRWPLFAIRIPYMRWCQAWMLLALAYLTEHASFPKPTIPFGH